MHMSVPLLAGVLWLLGPAAFAVWRVWVVRGRDTDRWLIDIESERLRVRTRGPLTQAAPGDWDALGLLAAELGVRNVVVAVDQPDANAGWVVQRAQQRIGSVARVTLDA